MRETDRVKHSLKRNRRLAYGAIATGLVIVVLLLLALNRGPISRGFEPEDSGAGLQALCPWCEEGEPVTATDILGIVLIALAVARDLDVPPAEIGRLCNELDIKIVGCQLGCF